MSDSKLYVIELGEDNGPLVPMFRLVRCKECRHMYEHADARGRWLLCNLQLYDEVKPEDFCSRGEADSADDSCEKLANLAERIRDLAKKEDQQ